MHRLAVVVSLIGHFVLADAFGFAPSCPLRMSRRSAPMSRSTLPVQMGFFDAIGKALQESMANDETLSEKQNPGFRDGYKGPTAATVTFQPDGIVVQSYAGERLGDVARRAGVSVTYGCQKGTCGSCEAVLVGRGKVRLCEAIVPKSGDAEASYNIQLADSSIHQKISIKRKLDWEQIKAKK